MKKISIIIPVYNEEDVILDCLRSLTNQTYAQLEVLIVDDGSSDSTISQVSTFMSKHKNNEGFNIRFINGAHEGAGAARNLGVSKSTGDILVFVDGDMTFDTNFIKNLVKPISEGLSKGTFSKEEYVSNWDNVWSRCWNINEGWTEKKRHPLDYPDKQKVFRAILKSEFLKVGGYTPGGYNDDWSLSEKLGYEADVAKDATFYHRNPSTLKEIYNHAKWVGKRSYKLGILGYVVALLRSSIFISIIVGLIKSFKSMTPQYLVFKVVYDFGIFVGILKFMFTKKGAK